MMRPLPVGTLVVVAAAVLIHGSPGADGLLFDRGKIAAGEWWRLFTGHLVHISGSHLFWNCALVLIAGWHLEKRDRLAWGTVVGLAVLVLGPSLYLLDGALTTYAGLSGIVVALIVGFAISEMRSGRTWFGTVVVGLLLLKIGVEVFGGELLLVDSSEGHRSVPLAHFLGLVCGLAALCVRDGRLWKARRGASVASSTATP